MGTAPPATCAVTTGRLTYSVTDRAASPKVVRTLRQLGIEIVIVWCSDPSSTDSSSQGVFGHLVVEDR